VAVAAIAAGAEIPGPDADAAAPGGRRGGFLRRPSVGDGGVSPFYVCRVRCPSALACCFGKRRCGNKAQSGPHGAYAFLYSSTDGVAVMIGRRVGRDVCPEGNDAGRGMAYRCVGSWATGIADVLRPYGGDTPARQRVSRCLAESRIASLRRTTKAWGHPGGIPTCLWRSGLQRVGAVRRRLTAIPRTTSQPGDCRRHRRDRVAALGPLFWRHLCTGREGARHGGDGGWW